MFFSHQNLVPDFTPTRQAGNANRPMRSDRQLHDDIDRCLSNADIDTSDVHIHVRNGAVSLTGTIASRRQQALLLDIVGLGAGALVAECCLGLKP